jgi:hypothetical protein
MLRVFFRPLFDNINVYISKSVGALLLIYIYIYLQCCNSILTMERGIFTELDVNPMGGWGILQRNIVLHLLLPIICHITYTQ